MPFPFVYLCDLLNDLERPHVARYPMLPKDLESYTKDKVIRWLRLHRERLNAFSTDSEAVMSMLQPESQTDRVYGLDPGSLELIIARALRLPRQHYLDLQQWITEPLRGDLGACVKRVMENMDTVATPGQANAVMVEEIHQSLLQIAAFDKRSSPAVQSLAHTWKHPDGIELLLNLYQRVQAREAKWLTRLILKSYAPIKFPENLEPGPQHSFLPTCVQLKIQFPRSAPVPVRRDGTRAIIGTGANEPAIRPPTLSGAAPQSSFPPSAPIAATARAPPTPATSSPQPASSSTAPSVSLQQPAFTTPASSVPSLAPSSSAPQLTLPPQNLTVSSHSLSRSIPCSSIPTPTPDLLQTIYTQPAFKPSSSCQRTRASQNSHSSTPTCTALGTISQNIPRSSQQTSPTKSPTKSSPRASMFIGGTGTCNWTSDACPLGNCVFMLGPCISKVPYITENLLSWHGSRHVTSVRALSHPSLQRRCSRTGKRSRKIALVESHRTQPTVDFLKRISSLKLTRKGKKEWIEVYDWRLLECITKLEQGKRLTYDPWVRCWICNV